jgi:hypothetical protein
MAFVKALKGLERHFLGTYTQVTSSSQGEVASINKAKGRNVFLEGFKVVDCGDAPLTFLVG